MAEFDGSIRINTEILTGKARRQLIQLENSIKNTEKQIELTQKRMKEMEMSAGPSKAFSALQDKIKATEQELERLKDQEDKILDPLTKAQAKMSELEKLGMKNTAAYKEAASAVEKLDKQWDALVGKEEKADDKLRDLQEKMQEMTASGMNNVDPASSTRYQALEAQLERQKGNLDVLKLKQREVAESAEKDAKKQATGVSKALEKVKSVAVKIGHGIKVAIVTAFNAVKTAAVKLASGIKNALQKGFNGIKSAAGKLRASLANTFNKIREHSKGVGDGFGGIGKKMLGMMKRVFVFAVITKALRALREGIGEAFNEYVKQDSKLNKEISGLMTAMANLRNAFVAAFAPLLSLVVPTLTAVVNKITEVTNTIGKLFAALTGKNTFKKMTAQAVDYAKSLDKTKESAKEAEAGLASFDELNTLDDKKDESNDNDEGAGGAMFSTENIGQEVADWAKMLKEAWENADFTEIGHIIGEKLRDALNGIPWDVIKEFASRLAKSIGTLINGFIETEGLGESIGHALGEAINTALTFLNDLLTTIHWDSVGQFFADGLNSIVNTVDWGLLADTLANMLNSMTEALTNFYQNTDWTAFGEKLGAGLQSFIDSVNWEGLGELISSKMNALFDMIQGFADGWDGGKTGEKIAAGINKAISEFEWADAGKAASDLIKDLLDFLIKLVEDINWQELGENVADFICAIDWSGLSDRVFEAIGAIVGGLAAFLWGLIKDAWDSVVAWWHDVAYEDGEFTIKGLLDGIWQGMKNIGNWINEHIFKPFINGFKKAFGIASPSKEMQTMGGFLMDGLLKPITEKIKVIVDKFNQLKNNIVKIFTNMKNSIKSVMDAIWSVVKKPINSILGGFEKMVNGVIDALNGMIKAINSLHFDLPDWVPLVGGKSLGFSIPTLSKVSVPKLAEGAVLRGGNPYLAMVNDQPAGQTNVETPLATITDAVRAANSDQIPLLVEQNNLLRELLAKEWHIDPDEIFSSVRRSDRAYVRMNGVSAFAT